MFFVGARLLSRKRVGFWGLPISRYQVSWRRFWLLVYSFENLFCVLSKNRWCLFIFDGALCRYPWYYFLYVGFPRKLPIVWCELKMGWMMCFLRILPVPLKYDQNAGSVLYLFSLSDFSFCCYCITFLIMLWLYLLFWILLLPHLFLVFSM